MWAPLRTSTRQPWHSSTTSITILLSILLLITPQATAQGEGLSTLPGNNDNVIIVDGFVDTTTCYEHLVEADANGDGKVQANEFVAFTQLQTPGGQLDDLQSYQEMPLAMQATFVTLTCLCRDERFGGDSRDVNCCLGVDAHIAIVGHDEDSSSQEKTRLFATCFLTDQAIVTVLGSDPPSASPTDDPSSGPTVAPTVAPTLAPQTGPPVTIAPTSMAPSTGTPSMAPTTSTPSAAPTTSPAPSTTTGAPTTPAPTVLFSKNAEVVYTISVLNGKSEAIPNSGYEADLVTAMNALATSIVPIVFSAAARTSNGGVRRKLQTAVQLPTVVITYDVTGTCC